MYSSPMANAAKALLTLETITDLQVRVLRSEAGKAGDSDMVHTCDEYLNHGSDIALEDCMDAINDARAMLD